MTSSYDKTELSCRFCEKTYAHFHGAVTCSHSCAIKMPDLFFSRACGHAHGRNESVLLHVAGVEQTPYELQQVSEAMLDKKHRIVAWEHWHIEEGSYKASVQRKHLAPRPVHLATLNTAETELKTVDPVIRFNKPWICTLKLHPQS